MKRFIFAACTAFAMLSWGITASQEWVKDYLLRLNGSTNQTYSVDLGGTNGIIGISYQLNTVRALMVTNSANSILPNGTRFAYTGNGVFTNKVVGSFIQATATNFVWNGIGSTVSDGFDRFSDSFSVCGGFITKGEAEGLK